jgi:hypothetical protein
MRSIIIQKSVLGASLFISEYLGAAQRQEIPDFYAQTLKNLEEFLTQATATAQELEKTGKHDPRALTTLNSQTDQELDSPSPEKAPITRGRTKVIVKPCGGAGSTQGASETPTIAVPSITPEEERLLSYWVATLILNSHELGCIDPNKRIREQLRMATLKDQAVSCFISLGILGLKEEMTKNGAAHQNGPATPAQSAAGAGSAQSSLQRSPSSASLNQMS